MSILRIYLSQIICFIFCLTFLEFVKAKSIQQKEVKVIENILFRSSDGEAFNGYLQTTDSRPLTVYCEATSIYSDITYKITILHQTHGAELQIVGRSVTFTPPLDLVVQCRASVSITSEDNYKNTLLIVKGQSPVRLTDGQQPNEGILQVLWNNTWSTVSQEGFASNPETLKKNGAVLCRMLGFSGFFKLKSSNLFSIKEEDHTKYLVKFECSGKENNIHNCDKTDLTHVNFTLQPASVICQSSHMLAPNQNAVLVSERKDIRVQIQVLPFSRSIYVTEHVTVKCLLEFQLPRFHVAQLFAVKNGSKHRLHSKITRATITNRHVQIIIEHNFTASFENSNTTFTCRGMDNISQVYKDVSESLIFKEGVPKVDVNPDPQKCTYNFQCAVNEKEAIQRSWDIYHFNKKVEFIVAQSLNLTLSCENVDSIEKICCFVNRKIYTATFSSEKCFDMRLHTSSKLKQTFTTLGFSGRYGIVQQYKVPLSGCYEILAKGASGGNVTYQNEKYNGGLGAKVVGKYYLVKNDVYTVIVGQAGKNSISLMGGGGGGASLVYNNSMLLIIAGGGCGAAYGKHGISGNRTLSLSSYCPYNKLIGGYGAGWQSTTFETSSFSIVYASSRLNYWLGGAELTANTASDGGFGGGGVGVQLGDEASVGGGGGGFIGGEALICNSVAFTFGGSSYCILGNSCAITEGGNPQNDGEVVLKYIASVC